MAQTDDDAWLAQLRNALAASPDERHAGSDRLPVDAPSNLSAHPGPSAQPTDRIEAASPGPAPRAVQEGDVHLREALSSVTARLSVLESAVQDIARQSRRQVVPDINQVEAAITRVVRAELPTILDARPAALPTAASGSVPHDASGTAVTQDVGALAAELRDCVEKLAELHRHALDELNSERRSAVKEAVAEIRKLLFGP